MQEFIREFVFCPCVAFLSLPDFRVLYARPNTIQKGPFHFTSICIDLLSLYSPLLVLNNMPHDCCQVCSLGRMVFCCVHLKNVR